MSEASTPKPPSYSTIFRDGLWDNNVAMGQMLG